MYSVHFLLAIYILAVVSSTDVPILSMWYITEGTVNKATMLKGKQ